MPLPIQTIQRAALLAEQLAPQDRVVLAGALLMASHGATVTVAATYTKVTDTAPRIAGTDFQALPFAPTTAHLGVIRKVALNRDGGLFFLLDDQARGNGEAPTGWTSLRPAGLQSFQIRGVR